MYERLLAGDADYNGRFFTGVLTTGIYCLPSCKARKPKSQNVRFFPSCEAARDAGLRPCKKCHPDDYARGADPVLETIETVVGEVRANPAAFADARAVVRRSGFGVTRAFELFRQHYHTTPAAILLRSRIDTTKRQLLDTSASPADLAFAAGFESLSAFHENFLRLNGLTPSAYRALASGHTFSLSLPNDYPLPFLRRALSRDIHSVTEKLQGDTYTAAVLLNGEPTLLRLQLSSAAIEVEVLGARAARPQTNVNAGQRPALPQAHSIVIGLLGLEQDAAAFARLAHKLGLARLVAGRRGLRLSQVPAVFDGLLWSIIGQQINFPFACLLRRRLIERTGTPLDNGLIAPPLPTAVATLEPADLRALQFSRQKADYVIAAARLVAEGKLDLAALRTMSATRAVRTLLAIHGLGPWSVNYLMMRALGFADCVPLGDTGVTSGLQSLFKLDPRPDIDATRRLMTVFSPYRSLATAHLWQFNQPSPT